MTCFFYFYTQTRARAYVLDVYVAELPIPSAVLNRNGSIRVFRSRARPCVIACACARVWVCLVRKQASALEMFNVWCVYIRVFFRSFVELRVYKDVV